MCALLIAVLLGISSGAAQGRLTVWSGVYADDQAERGRVAYERACIRCHGPDLQGIQDANLLGDFGPRFELTGPEFMERWREDRLLSLYNFMRRDMPPRNEPGVAAMFLEDREYLDIVTYVMQVNGFPAGNRELDVSRMRRVRIEAEDGPQPLPSFSLVQIVGCLTPSTTADTWQLGYASAPLRLRNLGPPTEQEIAASVDELLGLSFIDLHNLGYLGRGFVPEIYEGFKMQARGVLIRQPPILRINVDSLVPLAEECQ